MMIVSKLRQDFRGRCSKLNIMKLDGNEESGNKTEPFYKCKKKPTEEVMESLDLENDLSLAVDFPSLPASLEH